MAELPRGTVTFLLTDIEGSTALWEQAPEAMRPALARHDVLFESAVTDHGGTHIRPRGEGDSRFAVFASAPNAVAAALAVQRAFAAEAWPTPRPVKVRIGIHTGEAELRDGDYYGSAVNRCARLRSIGHGGQVLLSEATTSLARNELPSGAMLLDEGEHRLKDLTEPERVSQVTVPGLQESFPPLTSLDAYPHNFPIQPTALLGRERVVAEICALLRDDARLVTLTGPGGTGKTRLGIQVAAELPDRFEHGVFLVELAPISDPALVPSAIAQVLGFRDLGGRPLLDSLKEYLRSRTTLLVLDNFEQILPAGPVVADLLATSPGLRILVTSREPLHLRGEREYAVPPLALPVADHQASPEMLSQYAAVALFLERAIAIRSDFALTPQNAGATAEICIRLDGLPLAIELAAARIRLLPPQAMLTRLEHRLPLLTGGARDLPTRQQTLRGTIAWSYDLLDERERALFRRLAIFVGGFTLSAAEAAGSWLLGVGGTETTARTPAIDDLSPDTLDQVTSLVAKSLLRQEEGPDGEPRFGMLETIREFGLEQLEASGELSDVRDRHLEYFAAFAEAAELDLRGPRQAVWFDLLEDENDNLRAALAWSAADGDSRPGRTVDAPHTARLMAGIRLADTLEFFWVLRGRGRENLPRVTALVDRAAPGTAARARALLVAAHVRGVMLGDNEGGLQLVDEAEGICRALGDLHGTAMALMRRGQIVAFGVGDNPRATALFTEARATFRQLGGEIGPENPITSFLGQVARSEGDYDRALALLDESLTVSRERRDGHAVAYALREVAIVRHLQGDDEQAIALFRESIAALGPLKDIRCAHDCFLRLADVLSARGIPVNVARLFGAAREMRERIGRPLTPGLLAAHERAVAAVERRLDPEAFAAAWAEGRAMNLDEAIAYALSEAVVI